LHARTIALGARAISVSKSSIFRHRLALLPLNASTPAVILPSGRRAEARPIACAIRFGAGPRNRVRAGQHSISTIPPLAPASTSTRSKRGRIASIEAHVLDPSAHAFERIPIAARRRSGG
jgi:hypothetical protein